MNTVNPEDSVQFVTSVIDRYQTLCAMGVYPIEMMKIEAWINNFNDPMHQYIAAQMLDRLIYRSHKMAKEAYQSFLVAVLRDFYFNSIGEQPEPISDWLHQLSIAHSRYSERLVIAPVRCIADSGASGDTVCRMVDIHPLFTKQLTQSGFEGSSDIEVLPSNMVILLVDDMLGSGEQICEFSEAVDLKAWSQENHLIYAPLIAMESGLQIAQENLPFLNILPIEVLERNQHFFSFEENADFLGLNTVKEAEAIFWYKEMLKVNGLPFNKSSFGREKSALTLAFEWGCPNQTLAALWYSSNNQNSNWSRLFNRRE